MFFTTLSLVHSAFDYKEMRWLSLLNLSGICTQLVCVLQTFMHSLWDQFGLIMLITTVEIKASQILRTRILQL